MPRLVHLNRDCGLEPGGDLADALDRAEQLHAEGTINFGYSRQPGGATEATPGLYTLNRDAGLNSAGTHYDLPITVVPTRGSSLWIGSPNQDYTAHWVDGPLSTGKRKSFRSRVNGQAAILKNHDAFAALDNFDDWTATRSFTLELSLGRELPFLGEWHGIVGHEEDAATSRSAPLITRIRRGSNGVDSLVVDVRLQGGMRGDRMADQWWVSVPGLCGSFTRRDLRLTYTVGVGLSAWVDGVAFTTRRNNAAPPSGWTIADNRQLGAFVFPWTESENLAPDLTLHSLRLTATTPERTIRCAWSMEPEDEGRSFASRAEGRHDGWTKTRAFRVGKIEDSFMRSGIGMVKGVRLSRATFLCSGPGSDTDWMTPLRFGWSLDSHIDHISAPDGCFALIDNYGVSTYPVMVRDCAAHMAHSAIVARMMTLTVDQLHVAYWGRAVVRMVKGGGLQASGILGANGGHTVAAVVQDVWDHRSHISLSGVLNDNEEESPGCPAIYTTARKAIPITLRGVEWNKAKGDPPHLVHIDRRRSGVNPVTIEAGAVYGELAGLYRVDGDASQVTTWTEEDMGILKDKADALKADVADVKASLTNAIGRIDETVADVPHALQAMAEAREGLAVLKQALDGVAAPGQVEP
jgi:hypothetical protein